MELVQAAAASALFFYLFIPAIGAFAARGLWRRFRQSLLDSSGHPLYPSRSRPGENKDSLWRFFGELEAIEGEDTIWLSDGAHRVRVRLGGRQLFILPSTLSPSSEALLEGSAVQSSWQSLGSLPEGTRFFVSGFLDRSTLVPLFVHTQEHPLMVVIHDAEPELFLSRAIRSGRKRNEYWNSLSPYSFLSGVFAQLIIILNYLQRFGESPWLLLLIPLALLPFLILAPPGIFLYFLYRRLWKKGRRYRAERDLLRLPLRYVGGRLPDGGKYSCEIHSPQWSESDRKRMVHVRSSLADAGGDRNFRHFVREESDDPFAENLLIQGDPVFLARQCEIQAIRHEAWSLLIFLAGMIANVLLLQLLLLSLIFW